MISKSDHGSNTGSSDVSAAAAAAFQVELCNNTLTSLSWRVCCLFATLG